MTFGAYLLPALHPHGVFAKKLGNVVVLTSLDFAERLAREQQLTDGDSKSFEWIWSSDTGLKNWLSAGDGIFWICGKPASGKSTLMKYLTSHDSVEMYLQRNDPRPWSVVRFFFDFRAGREISNSFEGFMRSLLLQLTTKLPELQANLQEYCPLSGADGLHWTENSLRVALRKALCLRQKNICIFVDGLDEYEGNILELTRFLKVLIEKDGQWAIKICLASRPEPLIQAEFENCPGFEMQRYNLDGIQKYVSLMLDGTISEWLDNTETSYFASRFAEALGAKPTDIDGTSLALVSRAVAERAEGVYLWARFAINELVEGYAEGDHLEELLRRLNELDTDLNELYTRIFRRLKQRYLYEASILLQLVSFKIGILEVQELYVAASVAIGTYRSENETPYGASIGDLSRRVRARTGGLIEFVPIQAANSEYSFRPIDARRKLLDGGLSTDGGPYSYFTKFPNSVSNGGTRNTNQDRFRVELIHKTALTFLERNQWLEFSGSNLAVSTLPHTRWLDVIAKYLDPVLKYTRSVELRSKVWHQDGMLQWRRFWPQLRTKFLLSGHATQYIFEYARNLETETDLSSFSFLSRVLCAELVELHWGLPCIYCCNAQIDNDIGSEELPQIDPWTFATVLHGIQIHLPDREGSSLGSLPASSSPSSPASGHQGGRTAFKPASNAPPRSVFGDTSGTTAGLRPARPQPLAGWDTAGRWTAGGRHLPN
jgi:hypothetical protein